MRTVHIGSFRRYAVAAGLALTVIAVTGLLGYAAFSADEDSRAEVAGTGVEMPDRVDVAAVIERVNPNTYDMTVRLWVTPRGALAADPSGEVPAKDIVLSTSGITGTTVAFPAGRRVSAASVQIELDSGNVARYPFDRYSAQVYAAATAGGDSVPVRLSVDDTDTLFRLDADAGSTRREAGFDVSLSRTSGTLTQVAIMFAVMWALTLSVAAAAWVVVRKHTGIVWPALGWMAATIFALAAYRNTAPGSPPMGCLLDYTVFMWAETIVATSVVVLVARGAITETANDQRPDPASPKR